MEVAQQVSSGKPCPLEIIEIPIDAPAIQAHFLLLVESEFCCSLESLEHFGC